MTNELLAAMVGGAIGVIGACVAAIVTPWISERFNVNAIHNRLLEAVSAELDANSQILERALLINQALLLTMTEAQKADNNYTINNESKSYVSELVDMPLTNFVEAESRGRVKKFPINEYISYKLALYRANFLASRNKNFQYRGHFFVALVSAHVEVKTRLEDCRNRLTTRGRQ